MEIVLDDEMLAAANLCVFAFLLMILKQVLAGAASTTLEMHSYHKFYLSKMASAQGFDSEAQALQSVVTKAMSSKAFAKTLFDAEFHCVHCGSKNPAEWIKTRMGKKPQALTGVLSAAAMDFLTSAQLVKVGPPGPTKALMPTEPKRSDAGKAARICVDWAIKEYGNDAKGKGK